MGLLLLDLATLKDLDGGKPAIAFRRAVEDCVKDCADRPTERRSRKVTLELVLTPVPAEDPEFEGSFHADGATGEFKIKSAIPNRQTRPYSFGMDRNGRLFFSTESPANVKQTTFADVDPETGLVDRGTFEEVQPVEE
jgi:hypothetical protein